MVNNVGKFLTAFFFFLYAPIWCAMTLTLRDAQGKRVRSASVGAQYQLDVALDGLHGEEKINTIVGMDQCQLLGRSTNINVVNGRKQVRHAYIVRFARPGTFVLGPATTNSGSTNTITCTVEKEAPIEQQSDTAAPIFAHLTSNKSTCMIGEKIRATLEVCISDSSYEVRHIVPPQVNDAVVSGPSQQETTTRTIDGSTYTCYAWHWDIVPQKAGTVLIESCQIQYDAPADDPFMRNFALFGHAYKVSKRLASNDVTCTVQALPSFDKPVHGIGLFTHCNAHLNADRANEGDGVVLTLCVTSSAENQIIEAPALIDMPACFKWYESKQYLNNQGVSSTQCFEYIIQGMQPGRWVIPAQSFTFFDIHEKKYTTLSTQPMTLTITRTAVAHENQQLPHAADRAQENNEQNDFGVPADSYDWAGNGGGRALSWPLFFLLLSLPGVWLLAKAYHGRKKQYTNVYAHTRAQLYDAQRIKNNKALYHIFMSFFAQKLHVSTAQLQQTDIEDYLKQKHVSDAHIAEWRLFYTAIAEHLFAKQATVSSELFAQAYRWLEFFERKLP